MVAGPGAAYICEECLQLCQDILQDTSSFSARALELASRPPVVMAAPQEMSNQPPQTATPSRTIVIQLEQKQQGMTLLLQELQLFTRHFELHYLWMRPPLTAGFVFVPRLLFLVEDNTGTRWSGDRGGKLIQRSEIADDLVAYQGSARFSPMLGNNTHSLLIQVADPLGQFADPPVPAWQFEITVPM
jgi:hypothetical protein